MKLRKSDIGNWVETVYLSHRVIICIVVSAIVTTLFHLNIISNIRNNISNIIDLTAAVLVIITLILTLLLYLNDKDIYKEKLDKYKDGNKHIYFYTFRIAIANILCTCILIMIGILEIEIYIVKLILAFCGTYCFSYMIFGALYMLWFTIYIVVGINNNKQTMS